MKIIRFSAERYEKMSKFRMFISVIAYYIREYKNNIFEFVGWVLTTIGLTLIYTDQKTALILILSGWLILITNILSHKNK